MNNPLDSTIQNIILGLEEDTTLNDMIQQVEQNCSTCDILDNIPLEYIEIG